MSDLLAEQISQALENDLADRHSFFQLKHFVIGKEATTQGKMWQCVKEIRARKLQIEVLEREIDEANDRLELLDIQRGKKTLSLGEFLGAEKRDQYRRLALRENEVFNRQMQRQESSLKESLEQLRDKLKYTKEEAAFLVRTMNDLSRIEIMKPLDDLDAQKEYWTEKLANEVHLNLILRQPLGLELVKTVLSLHDDSSIKRQLCTMLAQNQEIETARSIDARSPKQS